MNKKGFSRRLCLLLAVVLTTTIAAAGCGGSDTQSAPTASAGTAAGSSDQPVELKWYTLGSDMSKITDSGLKATLDEANKTIKQKINATLNLVPIGFSDYVQKMQMIIASGEDYDICTTANWLLNLQSNASKGAFAPLNDQIQKYCKDLPIVQARYDAATINGKIYAIPVVGSVARAQGAYVRKDLADKYGFNTNGLVTYKDLETFYDKVKTGESGMYPTMVNPVGNTSWDEMMMTYGFDKPITGQLPGTIKMEDKSLNIINQYETQEFKDYAVRMKSWSDKGYFRKDAAVYYASSDNLLSDPNSGKVASIDFKVISPSRANEYAGQYPDISLVPASFIKPHIMRTGAENGNSVNANSKNIDRSVMAIALVNSDVKLLNTLIYGVEGKNYTKVSDNTVKIIDNTGYGSKGVQAVLNQCIGNQVQSWVFEGQDPDLAEKDVEFAKDATENYLMGFNADLDPIKSEVANCTSVVSEYLPMLATGSANVEKKLPEFIDKLKKAGSDKIIAELQKQVNQWKQKNGK